MFHLVNPDHGDTRQTEQPLRQRKPGTTAAPQSPVRTPAPWEVIPAETVAKWHRTPPDVTWDDLPGMTGLIARLREEASDILQPHSRWPEPARSYFFYGPPGSAIHRFAGAFIRELTDAGYHFLSLDTMDLHSAMVGVGEKLLQTIFLEARANVPCVLFFGDIENACPARGTPNLPGHAMRLTAAFLSECAQLLDSGLPVILLTTSGFPTRVDDALVRHSRSIQVPYPDAAARAAFLSKHLPNIPLQEGFSFQEMADATDQYSFQDLRRIAEGIRRQILDTLMANYRVLAGDGTVDQRATDLAAGKALSEGKVPLTRTMFDQSRKENPPTDKRRIREELQQFRASMHYD